MTNGPIVQVRGVHKYFTRGGEQIDVLNNLSLEVAEGEFLGIMGPSGSGKTTLLNLIAGLDRPSAGDVWIGSSHISEMSEGQLAQWRTRSIGFIFQFYHLLPVLTAYENVELPLLLLSLSGSERRQQVLNALDLVGLSNRLSHRPGQLSGGQQQRVGIARAIVTDPTLIVADEPTGDLDARSAEEILNLMGELQKTLKKTILQGLLQLAHQVEDLLGRTCVEVSGRFIGDNQGRIGDDGPGDADALLLAARKLPRTMPEAVRQPDEVQRGKHLALALGAAQVQKQERQLHVFIGREHRQKMVKLKDEPDAARPPLRELAFRHLRDMRVADPHVAGAGPIQSRDQIEQRCLARARRPHDAQELALGHFEAEIVEHVDLLAAARKILVNPAHPQNRPIGHTRLLLCPR